MLETITQPILIEDLGMMFATKSSKQKQRYGIFKCSCGTEFKSRVSSVLSGNAKSCGCYNLLVASDIHKTHGLSSHRLYGTWSQMISRTSNKKHESFKNYGGRGISVCERWKDITNFIEDMYHSYIEGLSIDRIDNNGNYEPSNCRWSTDEEQNRNTRTVYSHNTSGYRGVSQCKHTGRWKSYLKVSGRQIHLGRFDTAIKAAIAYNEYVIKHNLTHTINDY